MPSEEEFSAIWCEVIFPNKESNSPITTADSGWHSGECESCKGDILAVRQGQKPASRTPAPTGGCRAASHLPFHHLEPGAWNLEPWFSNETRIIKRWLHHLQHVLFSPSSLSRVFRSVSRTVSFNNPNLQILPFFKHSTFPLSISTWKRRRWNTLTFAIFTSSKGRRNVPSETSGSSSVQHMNIHHSRMFLMIKWGSEATSRSWQQPSLIPWFFFSFSPEVSWLLLFWKPLLGPFLTRFPLTLRSFPDPPWKEQIYSLLQQPNHHVSEVLLSGFLDGTKKVFHCLQVIQILKLLQEYYLLFAAIHLAKALNRLKTN